MRRTPGADRAGALVGRSRDFRWTSFEEMSGREVHDLLALRMVVFVVEQACAFAEIDGKDPDALHLRVFADGDTAPSLAGCLRVFAPPEANGRARIGRIATAAEHRGTGLGHRMMEEALRFCAERFPGCAIDLAAQAHLSDFYARHGFAPVSQTYLEDGIPHLDMRRRADRPEVDVVSGSDRLDARPPNLKPKQEEP